MCLVSPVSQSARQPVRLNLWPAPHSIEFGPDQRVAHLSPRFTFRAATTDGEMTDIMSDAFHRHCGTLPGTIAPQEWQYDSDTSMGETALEPLVVVDRLHVVIRDRDMSLTHTTDESYTTNDGAQLTATGLELNRAPRSAVNLPADRAHRHS